MLFSFRKVLFVLEGFAAMKVQSSFSISCFLIPFAGDLPLNNIHVQKSKFFFFVGFFIVKGKF